MKNPLWSAVALAGVLVTGVAAAAVNAQISPVSAVADTEVALVASTEGYDGAGLVTDIAALEAYPAPVIEVVEVVDPSLTPTVTPQRSHRKATSVKHKQNHTEASEDEHEDEDEYEDD
jgi:hypothetical protein